MAWQVAVFALVVIVSMTVGAPPAYRWVTRIPREQLLVVAIAVFCALVLFVVPIVVLLVAPVWRP